MGQLSPLRCSLVIYKDSHHNHIDTNRIHKVNDTIQYKSIPPSKSFTQVSNKSSFLYPLPTPIDRRKLFMSYAWYTHKVSIIARTQYIA
jgi:hypothetical protein